MGLLQEAAVWVGDHVTAPIGAKLYERKTGRPAKIVRHKIWSDEGVASKIIKIEWSIETKSGGGMGVIR